jgi:hypothetical protein
MMKCKKCGATLLMEQIPEVHISEAQAPCNQPGCDGVCTYINNKGVTPLGNHTASTSSSILKEDR